MLLAKNKRFSGLYVLLIVVYLLQTFLIKVNPTVLAKYRIDTLEDHVIALTVALPYIVIWLVALVGYLRLQNYGKAIGREREGVAFTGIASGVLWLSLWLPLSSIVAGFSTQYYTNHPDATASLVRFNNYFNLIILLLGTWLVYRGTEKLLSIVNYKKKVIVSQTYMYAYLILAGLYVYFTFQDPARQFPTHTVAVASYYEPNWLLFLTLVIPRLIYGFFGLMAVYNIYLYNTKVKGSLYKQALKYLTQGLIAVIITTAILRCIQSLSTPLEKFSLQAVLILVYVLLLLIAIGYVLIAKGAKKLQQFEEL
jgi:hypothetical protein